ncbi:hypothetical protein BC829DRAFT_399505 [Chytridium lagenaria]|nr:hypothetical protein BC829DRAFT_399505 [Chytridium lagenaria]
MQPSASNASVPGAHVHDLHPPLTKNISSGIQPLAVLAKTHCPYPSHRRIHLRKRDFPCTWIGPDGEICDRIIHVLTHLPFKAFECSECGNSFTRRDGLVRHINRRRCSVGREGEVGGGDDEEEENEDDGERILDE